MVRLRRIRFWDLKSDTMTKNFLVVEDLEDDKKKQVMNSTLKAGPFRWNEIPVSSPEEPEDSALAFLLPDT